MISRKRRVLIWLGSIFVIFVVGAGLFIASLDSNDVKRYASATARVATGRELAIAGDLDVDLGWVSRLRASGIQFQNASWSSRPRMFEVELAEVEIDLRQILKGRLVFPSVMLSQPRVILERNAKGLANWEFHLVPSAAEPAASKDRTAFPVIEKLIIKDGSLIFDNQETGAKMELSLARAEAAGFLEEPVSLKARGTYQNLPLNLSLNGGSYETLRSSKKPYPLRIELRAGGTRAKIDGNLIEPLDMKGEDVTLEIQGDDMAKLFPLIRVVFPSTPPYRLAGRLRREEKVWAFSDFSGRVGDSDLSGTIRIDTAPKPIFMKADLVSSLLDFDDLAGFIGGAPDPGETASAEQKRKAAAEMESDRIFPGERFSLERLKAMDADVRLRARRVLAPNLPIDNLDAKLTLQDGVLTFDPAAFGVADGRLEIRSAFDASRRPPRIDIDLSLQRLDLKRLLQGNEFAQKSLGPIGGRIVISGTGESFRDLMGTAAGDMFIAMSGGQVSALLVELAGLDVAETLGTLVRGDESIPIRCALLDLHGQDGRMGVRTLVFDTTDTIVYGEGAINLKDEEVNVLLTPVPKDFSPLSLRSFIRVGGSFKNLSVFPDPLRTGTGSLPQKILNVLAMLVLSPFQPRDVWLGQDVDCSALIDNVQRKDPKAVQWIGGASLPQPRNQENSLEPSAVAPTSRRERERDRG